MSKEFTEKEVEANKSNFAEWVERSGNKEPFNPNNYHGKRVVNTKI